MKTIERLRKEAMEGGGDGVIDGGGGGDGDSKAPGRRRVSNDRFMLNLFRLRPYDRWGRRGRSWS